MCTDQDVGNFGAPKMLSHIRWVHECVRFHRRLCDESTKRSIYADLGCIETVRERAREKRKTETLRTRRIREKMEMIFITKYAKRSQRKHESKAKKKISTTEDGNILMNKSML